MKNIFKFTLVSTLLFAGFLVAQAQDSGQTSAASKITFPIAELGSCGSQVECRAYCNKEENIDSCTEYASTHNLITSEQKDKNQKFSLALKQGGPGGCKGADACKVYCEDTSHTEECVEFAEKHGLASKENLSKAKKIGQTLRVSGGPGGCKSPGECRNFCAQEDNLETCKEFAEKHSLIENEQILRLNKFRELIKSGDTPGGCDSKQACEEYCRQEGHRQECADFVVKIGAISVEQGEKIKDKQEKTGPGGCDSREACEEYCSQDAHKQECLDFAKEHGLKRPEILENRKPTSTPTSKLRPAMGDAAMKECKLRVLGPKASSTPEQSLGQQTKAAVQKCLQELGNPARSTSTPARPQGDNERIKNCLIEKLGTDAPRKLQDPSSRGSEEVQTAMKSCGYTQSPPTQANRPADKPLRQNQPAEGQSPEVKGASTHLPWWQKVILSITGQ